MRGIVPSRRFSLFDALILIAAAAVGFALLKPALNSAHLVPRQSTIRAIELVIYHSLRYGTPVLIACTLASLGFSLGRPRPPLRRLVRLPGFILVATAIIGASYILLGVVAQVLISPSELSIYYSDILTTLLPWNVGNFVLGALNALLLIGRWRPRPVWTDRLAWSVGIFWVVVTPLNWASIYLSYWQ